MIEITPIPNINICETCGKPLYNDGTSTAPPELCKCYKPQVFIQGWQCPYCKTVYAPHITQCDCQKQYLIDYSPNTYSSNNTHF